MAKRHDLVFGNTGIESLVHTTLSGAVNGSGVTNSQKVATKHVLMTGAITVDVVVKLQDSPDNSVWTDVVAAEVSGADAGANTVTFDATNDDNAVRQLGYLGLQLWSRIAVTAGTGSFVAIAIQTDSLGGKAANS